MFHTPTAAYIPLPPFATLPTGASYTRIVEKAARRTLLPRTRQHEVPRIPLLRTPVNRASASLSVCFQRLLGAQPQRDVGRLHRLCNHAYQVVVECLQV